MRPHARMDSCFLPCRRLLCWSTPQVRCGPAATTRLIPAVDNHSTAKPMSPSNRSSITSPLGELLHLLRPIVWILAARTAHRRWGFWLQRKGEKRGGRESCLINSSQFGFSHLPRPRTDSIDLAAAVQKEWGQQQTGDPSQWQMAGGHVESWRLVCVLWFF